MITYRTIQRRDFDQIFPKKYDEEQKYINSLIERVPFSKSLFDDYMNHIFVLAMDGDKIVGISKFGIYGYDRNYWALAYISIDEKYRGKGISKELIKYTVKYLRDNNIHEFHLSTLESEGKRKKLAENFYKECKKYGITLHLSPVDIELYRIRKQIKSDGKNDKKNDN